jgi:hypothetical protein
MKRLLTIPAYLWAIACLLIVPIAFYSNDSLAKQLAKLPFMKIHPRYSGGEVYKTYQKDSLKITVNKPVFESLIGKSRNGFVQVMFSAERTLPAEIDENIDYDDDGNPDFRVCINTATGATNITSMTPLVKSLLASSRVYDNWIIRINLDRSGQ